MANPSTLKNRIHIADSTNIKALKTEADVIVSGNPSILPYAANHWYREYNRKQARLGNTSDVISPYDAGLRPLNYVDYIYQPWFKSGVSVGNLNSTYTEYSGITNPTKGVNVGYLWAVNGGSANTILALNKETAALSGVWTLTGASLINVKDCASCVLSGINYLFVADTGDTSNIRSTIQILRIKEPTITGSNGTVASGNIESIICQFPGGDIPSQKNIEAILVDPSTGDIYLFTQKISPIKCYKLAYQASYTGTQTLTSMGAISNDATLNTITTTYSANNGYITSATISPDGREILLKSYSSIYVWQRNPETETIYNCLARTYNSILTNAYVGGGGNVSLTTAPKFLHPYSEPQGCAISYGYSGRNIYTCSAFLANEGSSASSYPLFRYERINSQPTVATFQQGTGNYTGCVNTYIDSSSSSTSFGTAMELVCDYGYSPYPNISRTITSLLKFGLTGIGTGSTVVGSYIDLFVSSEGKQFQFNKLLVDFNSGSTQMSMSGNISFGTKCSATPDFRYGVTGTNQGIDSYTGWLRINLPVSTVQGWVNSPATNFGWAGFGHTGDSTADGIKFASTNTGVVNQRPKLTIVYT